MNSDFLVCRLKVLRQVRWLLPVLLLLVGGACAAWQQKAKPKAYTTVYIVRHGEKDLTPGLADPLLTAAGQQRAVALQQVLRKRPVSAVFSTETSRTRGTVESLATARKLTILPYNARQLPELAARIRQEYSGQTVVVVGHSNTILETAEALGATRPVPTVKDNEYDYLLEVKIPRDATKLPTATARRFGAASR
ncbi:histidine phosphatase family protein [Hymenobacter tenuis]